MNTATNVLPFPSRDEARAVATDFDLILTVYKDGVEHAVAIAAVNPQCITPNHIAPDGTTFKIEEFPGLTMRLELVASTAARPETGVAFMVTNVMKADLARRGFSPEQVSNMTPAGARRIVSGGELVNMDEWIASSLASAAKAEPPNAALPDEATVRKFIEIISAQAARAIADVEHPGVLQMSRIHPIDEKQVVPTRFAIGDAERMIKAAVGDAAAGHNVYLEGRTVRADLKGSKRGSISDTEYVFALVIDSDDDKGRGTSVTAEPSLVVESGGPGNFHFWYFLDRAMTVEQTVEIGKAVKAASGADANTGVVTQPYRVAGTPNFPSAAKKQRGRVIAETRITAHSGKLWTAAELLEAFKPAPGAEKHHSGDDHGVDVDEDFAKRSQQDERGLPTDLLRVIVNGVENDDRSERFFGVVSSLKRRFWSLDAIAAVLEKYPDGIAKKYAGRVHEEAKRCFDKIAPERDNLPIIALTKGALSKIVAQVEAALKGAKVPVFERGGVLVYPKDEEFDAGDGRKTVIAALAKFKQESLHLDIDRSANFVEYRKNPKTQELEPVTVDAPTNVTRHVLGNDRHRDFAHVAGIITTPLLRRDGSLLAGDREHYDPATRLYYKPGVKMPSLAQNPTKKDAQSALEFLLDLISEFPFVADVDRSVALSGILTALVRGSLDVAPLHLFRARTAGSGKSYLVDIASTVSTGTLCAVMAVPDKEEELEKRLGALVMRGAPIISLDNADQDIGGPALCQVTERPRVSLRILGKSEQPEYDCRSTVFCTGNNIGVRGDMTRRTLICNLDAGIERPELRKFTKNPIEMVRADRGLYIAAAFTIIKAYIVAGAPVSYPALGSYGQFGRMVRGPLMMLGQPDPVSSMDEARADDPELAAIRQLLISSGIVVDRFYRARDIVSMSTTDDDLRELLIRVAGERDEISNRLVGNWLRKISGRIVDGRRLVKHATLGGTVQYYLELLK
jgi:RepB DNA-primase from phage plasmid